MVLRAGCGLRRCPGPWWLPEGTWRRAWSLIRVIETDDLDRLDRLWHVTIRPVSPILCIVPRQCVLAIDGIKRGLRCVAADRTFPDYTLHESTTRWRWHPEPVVRLKNAVVSIGRSTNYDSAWQSTKQIKWAGVVPDMDHRVLHRSLVGRAPPQRSSSPPSCSSPGSHNTSRASCGSSTGIACCRCTSWRSTRRIWQRGCLADDVDVDLGGGECVLCRMG